MPKRSTASLFHIFSALTFLFSFFSLVSFEAKALSLSELNDSAETGRSQSKPVEVEWSGLLDMRMAVNGSDRNWANTTSSGYGGRGLTRFGASPGSSGSGTGFHFAQFSLVSDVSIKGDVAAHFQLNVSDHQDNSAGFGGIGLVEGYVKNQLTRNLYMRAGFLIPPISQEHEEVAWSTRYTITPSALNSWVGEEIRTTGLEIDYKLGRRFKLTASLFSHNDSNGSVLAYRGWAMHDYQATYGSRLRWNKVPGTFNKSSGWGRPFVEQDDRLGGFAKISYLSRNKAYLIDVSHYDNRAKNVSSDGVNYGWRTKFSTASINLKFGNGLRFITQAMMGSTSIGDGPTSGRPDVDYFASYVLLSYYKNYHRFSFRYDQFEVEDNSTSTVNITDDNSEGTAMTAAYFYHKKINHQIGFEVVMIESKRNGDEGYGDSDPDDNLTQLMYRFIF